jgi:hypothetical protein
MCKMTEKALTREGEMIVHNGGYKYSMQSSPTSLRHGSVGLAPRALNDASRVVTCCDGAVHVDQVTSRSVGLDRP